MTGKATTHELMLQAIRFLEESRLEQPSLPEIARHFGVSPSHFQRTFTRWVGISPKRYLQYLTLGNAKRRLRENFTVLDATLDTGLSSPSRLHDLFLTWEAMTPGEYAAGGAGLEIHFGWFDSPFGEALALGTGRGLCGFAFAMESKRAKAFEDMAVRWPRASYSEKPEAIADQVSAAFGGGAAHLLLSGTPFQLNVWKALLSVPPGSVTSYSELARAIGNPNATRAVGSAVGRNPIAWLIPCHRAVRKSGELGGYHWGLDTKRAMLAWEAIRSDEFANRANAPA